MITILRRDCPVCHKFFDIELDTQKYDRWVKGEHVQDVWPEKNAIQREQLITGVCSDECWDELFR